MRAFVETRIKPYYLPHPDLAPGTTHFRLSIEEGQRIVSALRGRISGLCQPTYVRDIPGGHGKAPIGGNAAEKTRDGRFSISDFSGNDHIYPPQPSGHDYKKLKKPVAPGLLKPAPSGNKNFTIPPLSCHHKEKYSTYNNQH